MNFRLLSFLGRLPLLLVLAFLFVWLFGGRALALYDPDPLPIVATPVTVAPAPTERSAQSCPCIPHAPGTPWDQVKNCGSYNCPSNGGGGCCDCNDATGFDEVLSISYRSPRGHTHTCSQGHTWDHDSNSGHTCTFPVSVILANGRKVTQECGLVQTVQDSRPKPVAVVTRLRVRQRTTVNIDGRPIPFVTTHRSGPFDLTGDPLPIVHGQTQSRTVTQSSQAIERDAQYAAPLYAAPLYRESYQSQSFQSFSSGDCVGSQCNSGLTHSGTGTLSLRARIREGGPVRRVVGALLGGCN